MQEVQLVQNITNKPLFEPTYLNIEYVFDKVAYYLIPVINFIFDANTWRSLGIISVLISIFALTIIIFSLVRMYEIQVFDKEEIEHEIAHALAKQKERERNLNPRWKYILTLIESPNESDWRVAIMESDSLLEESLSNRGIEGDTLAELLEGAKSSGYRGIDGAWEAHITRNKIAHEGSDFPLTQIEARRVIKLYQNIFEELEVI